MSLPAALAGRISCRRPDYRGAARLKDLWGFAESQETVLGFTMVEPRRMARNLEDRYIYSMKPQPADLAMDTLDEDRIRMGIRRDLEATRGCRLEIIMKDTNTIRNEPGRLVRWVEIVRKEIEAARL